LIHKVKRLNLFIFEILLPETGLVTDIGLLCHMVESSFHEDFANLFLIHREDTYEPIMLIDSQASKVLQRTFAYDKQNRNADSPANVVYDLWRSVCQPETFLNLPEEFSRPLTAHETKRMLLRNNLVEITGQIITPDGQCQALILKPRTKKTQVRVPVLPSEPLYDSRKARQVPMVAGDQLQTPGAVKKRLESLAVLTGLNIRPVAQVLDDKEQTVALLLENTLLAPTKPSKPSSLLLPIEPDARYYSQVDEYIRSGQQLTDERVVLARARKRQRDFWYNLLIHLALYFRQNAKDKRQVIAIQETQGLDLETIKTRLHQILPRILVRVLNRRRLRQLFPVNILGIRSQRYDIVSERGNVYEPCSEFSDSAADCNTKRHCEYNQEQERCEPTPEQQIISNYYFAILHEIATDPTHRLVNGQLGQLLKLVEKQESAEEEIIQ
jgi:hypothetical protein